MKIDPDAPINSFRAPRYTRDSASRSTKEMKVTTSIGILLFLALSVSAEYSFITPDTITYNWTVRTAQETKIPKLKLTEITVGKALEILSDSSVFQLRVEAQGISEEKLNERITIQKEKIAWIEIVSIIADEIEADILITKGRVILKPQSTKQPQ